MKSDPEIKSRLQELNDICAEMSVKFEEGLTKGKKEERKKAEKEKAELKAKAEKEKRESAVRFLKMGHLLSRLLKVLVFQLKKLMG